jgi:glucosyl-dolichyl phosphate glucuronosyltransferase
MIPVTVAICTWRRPILLARALDSLKKQSFQDFTVLVIDNNSKDTTPDVVQHYIPFFKQIRYACEEKQGVTFARNCALYQCDTPYLAYLDDDEVADSMWLENLYKAIQHDTVAIAGGRITLEWEGTKPLWLDDSLLSFLGHLDYGHTHVVPKQDIFVGNMIVDVAKVKSVGGFHHALGFSAGSLIGNEEIYLQRCIRRQGFQVAYSHEAIVSNLVSADKITKNFFKRRFMGQGMADARVWRLTYTPSRIQRWYKIGTTAVYCLKLYKWLLMLFKRNGLLLQYFKVWYKIGIIKGLR